LLINMLALSSSAAIGFSPIQAIATRVASVGIVGMDSRALRNSIEDLSPLRAAQKALSRVAEHVVMTVPDQSPKVVGDLGFDPLSLGSDDNFAFMREAEIKHGRLAMMAAIAWPTQEILNPILVRGLGMPDVLEQSGGASPSLLNGGLGQNEIFPALLLFVIGTSLLEETDLTARKSLGCAWNEYPDSFGTFGRQPGNFGFDPLKFYQPLSYDDKVSMQERELLNGRVAMAAVATFVGVEFFGQTTVVRATPALFEPLIFQPWFRAIMDSSFGMASMDGSINGVAY